MRRDDRRPRSIQNGSAPPIGRPGWPALGIVCCLLTAGHADEFVDVLGSPVWARKGGLACDSAEAAASGGGFFSACVRLPVATRVVLVVSPEVMTRVYKMRIIGAGSTPKFAWFSRESLTNNPTPDQFMPDP